MDLYEAMYTTRAMRRVKPDPISDETLGRLFDAAVRGPSGGNRHTFRFLTVTDKEMMKKIKDIYHDAYWELQETSYAEVQTKLKEGDPNDPGVKQTRRISNSAEYFVEYLDQHPMLIFVLENKEGNLQHFRSCGTFA